MANPFSRQSSSKSKHSAFVPSPRFLSESPAKNRSPLHVDYPGQPSRNDLRSPIPPPPANLYPGTPLAFTVDPGAPFLAAVAPTDDHRSENGSTWDDPGPKGFTGAVVSGIKNVVKRSLRDRSRSQYTQKQRGYGQVDNSIVYDLPPQLRDSGYAVSSVPIPPSGLPPMPQNLSTPPSSRHTSYSARAPSETLLGHAEDRYDKDDATIIGHSNSVLKQQTRPQPVNQEYEYGQRYESDQEESPAQQYQRQVMDAYRLSQTASPSRQVPRRYTVPQPTYSEIIGPEDIASPVSADLQIGPNYKQMDVRTPPPSEISFNTYLKRLQKFASDVNSLPWIAKERVTKDYYPERSRRSDEPKKAPAIVWRSEAFLKAEGYHDPEGSGADGDGSFSEWSGVEKDGSVRTGPGMHAPRRGSRSAMDLDAEFEGSRTPLPANQPNLTPYTRPRGVQLTDTPMPPRVSQPPDSVLFQKGPPPVIPDLPLPQQQTMPVQPGGEQGNGYVHIVPSHPPPIIAQTPNTYTAPVPPMANQYIPQDPNAYSRDYSQPFGPEGQNTNAWYPPQVTPPNYSIEAVNQLVPTAEFPYLGPNPDWAGGQPPPPPVAFPSPPRPLREQDRTNQSPIFIPPSPRPPPSPQQLQPQQRTPTGQPPAASFPSPAPAPPRPREHDHAMSPSPVIPPLNLAPAAPTFPNTPRASTPISAPQSSAPPSPSPAQWEQYATSHRTGYVPAHYAEHYYGEVYGPGVHAARPPVVQPPVTVSAGSGSGSGSGRSGRSDTDKVVY
ncbi:hypothetical protein JR316_0013382 [Psilocybe cubensis]|uniref:Uncharacterized protein n=1 Tax=Psilocybe cubensis TaxID=181762 RepID=A0ACB8GHF4_PSICU|nr:hypothetical protein JR316_0013382 [Psilocybe cubensis]KAH9474914.1 hypothetical protein JR316_0013382 [Psilocybe cubensis]